MHNKTNTYSFFLGEGLANESMYMLEVWLDKLVWREVRLIVNQKSGYPKLLYDGFKVFVY